MPAPWLIVLKAVDGGFFVALFAVLGEMLQPKRFAGILGASPAVSIANLLVIALVKGDTPARDAATGMIAGAIALVAACAAAIPAVRRWGSLRGSAVLWGVWMAVGAAVGVPIAGGAAAGAGTGRLGRSRHRQQGHGDGAGKRGGNGGGERGGGDSGGIGGGIERGGGDSCGKHGGGKSRGKRGGAQRGGGDSRGKHGGGNGGGKSGGGPDGGRLFAVDVAALREIRPRQLAVRFAFGAAVSVVAGLIGIAAGQRAGGVLLAAPAVLPATLTIIEKEEGRGPAVTETQGSVLGALALIGFALVAVASLTHIPLAAALLSALAAWIIVSIGGYLAQAALLPAWQRDVRDIAWQRRDATLARRAEAARPPY